MTSLQSEYALEDTNFPALRFKEFSDNWEDSKLGEICEFLQGVQVDLEFQISNQKEGYIKFLRIENYTQNSLDFRFIPINLSKNKFIDLDDIVVVRYGATAGFISRGHSGVLANNLFKIIPNENKLDKNYLFLLLKSDKVFKFFQLAMAGGAMPALSFKIVGVLPLSFPSIPEQTKIANFLTAVDEKITLLTQKAALLSQYKKGVMQQIFSQELRFKDDDGQEFPEWEEKTLKDMLDIVIDNRGKTPPTENIGNPLLEVNSIGKKDINFKVVGKFVSDTTYHSWFRKHIKNGDILFSTVGATAQCSYFQDEQTNATIAQNIVGLRFKNIYNSLFMFYVLTVKKNNQKFKTIEMGAVQPSVKVSQMIHLFFSIPSLPEQTKIANFLTAIDEKITNNQTQLNAVKQYKQGLLQQMFV